MAQTPSRAQKLQKEREKFTNYFDSLSLTHSLFLALKRYAFTSFLLVIFVTSSIWLKRKCTERELKKKPFIVVLIFSRLGVVVAVVEVIADLLSVWPQISHLSLKIHHFRRTHSNNRVGCCRN